MPTAPGTSAPAQLITSSAVQRDVGARSWLPARQLEHPPTSAPEDQIAAALLVQVAPLWAAGVVGPAVDAAAGGTGVRHARPHQRAPLPRLSRESVRLLRFGFALDVHSHAARVQPLAGWQGRAGCSRRSSGGGGGGGDPLRAFTRQRTTALARSWRGARHHASPEGRKSAEAAEQRAGPLAARWCRRRHTAATDGHGCGIDPLNRWSASLPGNAPKTGVSSGWEL